MIVIRLQKQVVQTKSISYMMQQNCEKEKFNVLVKDAEYKLVMGVVVEHNSPMLLMDHLPKLIASVTPDSTIAKSISRGRTKATQIIHMLKAESETVLVTQLRLKRFSIIIDETTDISTKKCLAV